MRVKRDPCPRRVSALGVCQPLSEGLPHVPELVGTPGHRLTLDLRAGGQTAPEMRLV